MTKEQLLPDMSPRRIRIGGAGLILCALMMAGIHVFLAASVLNLPYAAALLPDYVRLDGSDQPEALVHLLTGPAGLVTLWVGAFALVTLVLGLDMLLFARRSRWLFWPLLVLVAIFTLTCAYAALQSGSRMPRLHF
jgi:hypothetical protein